MKFCARNQIRNSVSQEAKLKTAKHQKNNWLFRRNNRLFIPVKTTTIEFKEFREERDAQTVYIGSLLNQELHLVSQKPLRIPLSNQNQITYTYHQRSDLDPLKKHTSFSSAHTPRMLILTTSRAHNPSWLYNTRMYKVFRTKYTCYRMNWNQYRCNHIPLSLDKPKLKDENSNLWKTICEKLKFVFLSPKPKLKDENSNLWKTICEKLKFVFLSP